MKKEKLFERLVEIEKHLLRAVNRIDHDILELKKKMIRLEYKK